MYITAKCKGKVELEGHSALQEGVKMAVFDWMWEKNQYFRGLYSVFRGLKRREESRLNCMWPEAVLPH